MARRQIPRTSNNQRTSSKKLGDGENLLGLMSEVISLREKVAQAELVTSHLGSHVDPLAEEDEARS